MQLQLLQPASLPVSFLSVTRRRQKQCELIIINFACAGYSAYCKGGENLFKFSRILFKRLRICNYNKEQTTPKIYANQNHAILIQLNHGGSNLLVAGRRSRVAGRCSPIQKVS